MKSMWLDSSRTLIWVLPVEASLPPGGRFMFMVSGPFKEAGGKVQCSWRNLLDFGPLNLMNIKVYLEYSSVEGRGVVRRI
jgi:hypothetical protein